MDKGQLLQIISAILGILAIGSGFWGSRITEKGYIQTLTQTLTQFSKKLVGLDQKFEEKIKKVQPIKSKIVMTKQQRVPPNVETILNFDRLIYDTQDGFWQEGRPGFCSRSGVYDLALSLYVQGMKGETSVLLIIQTPNQTFSREYTTLSRAVPSLSIKKSFDIDLGDTVVVSLRHQNAQDLLISPDEDQTYLTIEEIGSDL